MTQYAGTGDPAQDDGTAVGRSAGRTTGTTPRRRPRGGRCRGDLDRRRRGSRWRDDAPSRRGCRAGHDVDLHLRAGQSGLLELMVDRTVGDGAARRLRAIGGGTRRARAVGWALYRRHPWLLDSPRHAPCSGPTSSPATRLAGRGQQQWSSPPRDIVAVVSLIDGYVRGAARAVVDADLATARTGQSEDDWWTSRAACSTNGSRRATSRR